MFDKPLDVTAIVSAVKFLKQESDLTDLINIDISDLPGDVHINDRAMTQVAPLDKWTLNQPRKCETFPYLHIVAVDRITFYAITTDPITLPEAVTA